MGLFCDDPDLDAQAQRTAAATGAGAADLGEVVAVTRRVSGASYDSWFDEWSAQAAVVQARAEGAAAAGRSVSAARGFLRATEYWRQSFFFLRHDLDDERLQSGWRAHRAAFGRALSMLGHHSERATVELDGTPMTGYLIRPRHDDVPRPTLIYPAGYDSTAESGWAGGGYMALSRDWNALVFEGPGQGGVLYEHRVPMRPDFDAVLTPMVDWLTGRPGVDPDRLVLVGRSFAGYLAPRAAGAEHRIAALVCDPAQYDFTSRIVGWLLDPPTWERVLAADPDTDAQLQGLLDSPRNAEWFGARMATMGAATVGEFLRLQPLYTLEGRAPLIRCPTLLTEGEGDFAAQTDAVAAQLTCPTTVHRFPASSGAGGHCEGLGATLFEEVACDWIAGALASRPTRR